ncbi:DUF3293 domain-containing protein [Asaia sp. W19]|uniref:DUF3293 domain-containing protein n=1 Tax=unclassified Asaia TaxID=2685023 RepID=UPI000F8CF8F3|nr:DUF3293 domain-containing protein [Asaia sp. W19]RUT27061.1 DUF3293 domain-containing protein [Asaia sp. W19]
MQRPRPPTPSTRRAYSQTCYDLAQHTIRIGERLDPWPFRSRALVLISACNPSGRRQPEGINRRAMAHLRAHLSVFDPQVGYGHWRGWGESFLAVALPMDRARVLGRRFGQNALVYVVKGRKARLIWLYDRRKLPHGREKRTPATLIDTGRSIEADR